jgi:hypothetical protein
LIVVCLLLFDCSMFVCLFVFCRKALYGWPMSFVNVCKVIRSGYRNADREYLKGACGFSPLHAAVFNNDHAAVNAVLHMGLENELEV